VVIDLESMPEPDDPGSGMPGLAQLVAVHAQHQLRAGQGLLVSNTRWLHGRDHYTGPRV
jgi:hypothetical protein